VRLSPGNPKAHRDLAASLESDGQAARAREEYERYLELEPTAPDAEQVRARLKRLATRG